MFALVENKKAVKIHPPLIICNAEITFPRTLFAVRAHIQCFFHAVIKNI